MFDERLLTLAPLSPDDDPAPEPALDELRAALAVLAVLSMDDLEDETIRLH